jgi:hypothetical protein
MMATMRTPTTTGQRQRGSRFFASPSRVWRRAPRWRNARPAKRVAGPKTASRIFFRAPPKTRPETATQTLGTHQETWVWAYDFAPGCAVAPNRTEEKKIENDCTRAYDAILYNTPALPEGGRWDRALQSSGLDLETRLSQAWKESSFNPSASAAPRSSALGMFQFLTGTANDVETRVWPNFVSRTTPFLTPGVTGDWRLDPVNVRKRHRYAVNQAVFWIFLIWSATKASRVA